MTDPTQIDDAREAEDMGEAPNRGRQSDALTEAVSGSGMGSDTRAGSLQGGAATGSEIDPDQDRINQDLAQEGLRSAAEPQEAVDPYRPAATSRPAPAPERPSGSDADVAAGAD